MSQLDVNMHCLSSFKHHQQQQHQVHQEYQPHRVTMNGYLSLIDDSLLMLIIHYLSSSSLLSSSKLSPKVSSKVSSSSSKLSSSTSSSHHNPSRWCIRTLSLVSRRFYAFVYSGKAKGLWDGVIFSLCDDDHHTHSHNLYNHRNHSGYNNTSNSNSNINGYSNGSNHRGDVVVNSDLVVLDDNVDTISVGDVITRCSSATDCIVDSAGIVDVTSASDVVTITNDIAIANDVAARDYAIDVDIVGDGSRINGDDNVDNTHVIISHIGTTAIDANLSVSTSNRGISINTNINGNLIARRNHLANNYKSYLHVNQSCQLSYLTVFCNVHHIMNVMKGIQSNHEYIEHICIDIVDCGQTACEWSLLLPCLQLLPMQSYPKLKSLTISCKESKYLTLEERKEFMNRLYLIQAWFLMHLGDGITELTLMPCCLPLILPSDGVDGPDRRVMLSRYCSHLKSLDIRLSGSFQWCRDLLYEHSGLASLHHLRHCNNAHDDLFGLMNVSSNEIIVKDYSGFDLSPSIIEDDSVLDSSQEAVRVRKIHPTIAASSIVIDDWWSTDDECLEAIDALPVPVRSVCIHANTTSRATALLYGLMTKFGVEGPPPAEGEQWESIERFQHSSNYASSNLVELILHDKDYIPMSARSDNTDAEEFDLSDSVEDFALEAIGRFFSGCLQLQKLIIPANLISQFGIECFRATNIRALSVNHDLEWCFVRIM